MTFLFLKVVKQTIGIRLKCQYASIHSSFVYYSHKLHSLDIHDLQMLLSNCNMDCITFCGHSNGKFCSDTSFIHRTKFAEETETENGPMVRSIILYEMDQYKR
jgi:hypothetical protein